MKISWMLKTGVAVIALCGLSGLAEAQDKEKKVKDQAEYDMLSACQKETVPAKKVEVCLAWKDKYPESDFKADRLVMLIPAYQQLQQADKMYATAKELKAIEPSNPNALYFLTILPPAMNVTTPERLAEAEQNAAALQAAIPTIFANAPKGVDPAAFAAQRKGFEQSVVKTNVWVATQRKDMAKVEQIYTEMLKKDPTDANASYELGRTILAQKKTERQAEALYHIGRAAYEDGPNALAPNVKTQVQAFFERTVTQYTGSKEDVKMIADQTKASAFPPPGFEIKSQQQKMADQEEKMKADDPQKYLWFTVKKALIEPDGAAYFDMNVKGSGLPKLKGKLVSALPANKPKEVTIAIMDDTTPEIKLIVDPPYAGAPPAGTVLEFETAVPSTFSADPFLVTADIEQDQITGWPADMKTKRTGPKKAAAPAKPAAKKKQ